MGACEKIERNGWPAWADIAFVAQREADVDVLIDLIKAGQLPERITHNDTKLNNVVIDDTSREAICVVDLATADWISHEEASIRVARRNMRRFGSKAE